MARGAAHGARPLRPRRRERASVAAPVAPRARRRAGLILLASLLLAGCSRRPPSFIVLSIDTLNRDALRAFNPTAPANPALDRFASRGLRLAQAVSTAGWTLPAHGSVLTGLFPNEHGVVNDRRQLRPEVPTLAGMLGAAGYERVGFTDGGFLSPAFGFNRGFEVYDDWVAPGVHRPALPRDGAPLRSIDRDPFDRAVAYLKERPAGGRPLLLFLHTYAVHDYYNLKPWARSPVTFEGKKNINLPCLVGGERCSPAHWAELRRLYAERVHVVDASFGRLLAALDRTDLRDSVYVILIADHGEGLDPDHQRTHHGGRLDPDLLRIPMIIGGPGVAQVESEVGCSLVDVAPTILELAGVPIPPSVAGRSLLPVIADSHVPSSPRTLYASDYAMWWEHGIRHVVDAPRSRPLMVAVLQPGIWYVRTLTGETFEDGRGDPARPPGPEAATRLRQAAARLMATDVTAVPRRIDPALDETLRALGYAVAAPPR
jgi:choline-sulfatase